MASLLRASLISIAATLASLAAGFASNIIVARLLGPEGSGTVAYAIWVALVASALADRGLPQTLLRSLGSTSESGANWQGLVRATFPAFLLSVGLVGLALAAYAGLRTWQSDGSGAVWSLTALLFLAYALANFSSAVDRGRGRFDRAAAGTLCGGALQVPIVFLGAVLFGPAGAIAGHVARYLPQALRVRVHRGAPRRDLTPSMRAYGRHLWLSDLIEMLAFSRLEFLFLGYFFGTREVGYFAVALALAGLLEQIVLQLSAPLIVGFADAFSRDDRERIGQAYRQVMRMVALLLLPVSFGGAVLLPALLPLLFGEDFQPAVPAAILLMVSVSFDGLSVVPWAMIGAAGRGRSILHLQLAGGVVTILLLAVVVPWAGLLGAAACRAVASLLTFAMLVFTARRQLGLKPPLAILARTAAAALLCAAGAAVVIWRLEGPLAIALAIPVGAAIYLVSMRWLRLVETGDGDFIIERLPGRLRPIASGLFAFLAPR